jgi:polyhydroxyalkanoate synthase
VALLAPDDLVARLRRDVERSALRARNGLKLLADVGRPTTATTPKDTVWSSEKVQLWRYRSDRQRRPVPLLLVHSLVSRSYVFDMAPGNSFVENLVGRGFDVYLLDWGVPDELEATNTLETYTDDYIPAAIDVVREMSESDDVDLFGYCFGGVLSLLYAAGHPDAPLRSLSVLATPIDFTHMGPFTTMLQEGRVDPDDLIDPTGNVPPDAILSSFRLLAPTGDLSGYVNLWQHLWNDDYVDSHRIMTGWARDHIPFPGAAFRQTAELFTRGNLLLTGRVPLGDRVVDLGDITVPFLSILGEKDHIVPPESTSPLVGLVGSEVAEEMRLPAGHVGLIVGRAAQLRNIPAMAEWIAQWDEADG